MIALGQQVRIRNGVRVGEFGVVIDSEICDRNTIAGWQPCAFWYVEYASDKAIGIYEETALELAPPQLSQALSISVVA